MGRTDLPLTEGVNTIVYAWGSLEDDNLDLAIQTIDGLHGDPGGVPSGEAGLMGTNTAAVWILAAAGAAGVALASRRLATQR